MGRTVRRPSLLTDEAGLSLVSFVFLCSFVFVCSGGHRGAIFFCLWLCFSRRRCAHAIRLGPAGKLLPLLDHLSRSDATPPMPREKETRKVQKQERNEEEASPKKRRRPETSKAIKGIERALKRRKPRAKYLGARPLAIKNQPRAHIYTARAGSGSSSPSA